MPRPSQKTKQPEVPLISTAPGVTLLINPFTQQRFTPQPVEAEVDDWVKVQIAHGKLIHAAG